MVVNSATRAPRQFDQLRVPLLIGHTRSSSQFTKVLTLKECGKVWVNVAHGSGVDWRLHFCLVITRVRTKMWKYLVNNG